MTQTTINVGSRFFCAQKLDNLSQEEISNL